MKKVLLVFFCSLLMVSAAQLSMAQEEGKEGKENSQDVHKEIKDASKEVAKESKNIFRETGKAGKRFWRGMKEGFKETK